MKISLIGLSLFSLLFMGACSRNSSENDSGKPEIKNNITTPNNKSSMPTDGNGTVEYLNTQNFVHYVFDFRTEKEWKLKSSTPCVVDFYTDWCKPCKTITPYLQELAAKYKGEIQFYKINIDHEQEVADAFRIESIPTVMICPLKGKPVMTQGAMPKSNYQRMIEEIIFTAK